MKTLEYSPDTKSSELKAFLRDNWSEGAICPCCNQVVKKYRRPITSSMALGLILISKENNVNFMHLETFFKNKQGLPASIRADIPKLRFWGLIKPSEDNEGEYQITQLGVDFAQGKITVPKYCLLYNNKCYGLEGEKTGIKDCLKTKFNYELLMAGVL